VEAVIGSGGTAVVYRVRHQTLGTRHALKVLSITSDVIRERMLTEGRVQATLQHPNVVEVTDVLDVDDAPGLLMEYVEGPSLDKALEKYRINRASAETLFLGIAAGVSQAHQHGLVHRDLKPANVLLARTSDGFVPKVTDFGLAKVLAEARGKEEGHTRSGVALGTPAYMAPEQVRDARTVDRRADVFTLGCILYELMTGRRAFPGEDTIAIYNQILDGRYVPPRHFVPELEDRVDNAIKGALIIDRELRIPDTDTLLQVLAGEVVWEIPDLLPPDDDVELIPDLQHWPLDGASPLPLATTGSGGEADDLGALLSDPSRSGDPLWASIHDSSFRGGLPPGPRPETPVWSLTGAEPEPPGRGGLWFLGGAGAAFLVALLIAVVGTSAALLGGWWDGGNLALPSPAPTTGEQGMEEPSIASAVAAPEEQPEVSGDVDETEAVSPEPEPPPAASVPSPRPAARPVAPAPPAVFTVKILTSPPTAALKVDGVERGRTPAKLSLAPGSYSVEVQSGDQVGTFSIDVGSGGENKWCYSFGAATSTPGSCI
jgi:serine/threonine-protein kinase